MTDDPYSPDALEKARAELPPAPQVPAGPPVPDSGPTPPTGLPAAQLVIGGLLILVGAGWLVASLGIADLPWRGILAAVLVFIGGLLVGLAGSGRHSGLIVAGVILSLVLAVASTAEGILDVPFRGGIGERTVAPAAVADLDSPYRLAIGQLTVDLDDVPFPDGVTEVEATLVIGQLVVDVPPGVAVRVEGRVGAGSLRLLGDHWDGIGVDETAADPGYDSASRRLLLKASVGLGEVVVNR